MIELFSTGFKAFYFLKQKVINLARPHYHLKLLVAWLILIAFIFSGCSGFPNSSGNQLEDDTLEMVVIGGREFHLELALNNEERNIGLMGRESLSKESGMLFVFPDNEHFPQVLSFWMKDCLIPIDIIFLTREGMITAIHEMVPPDPGQVDQDLPRYSSRIPAQFAIEISGGLTRSMGLRAGDRIEIRSDYLLELAQ